VRDSIPFLVATLLIHLTVNLRIATVYEATSYYDVAAGIGAFDGSLVGPTLNISNGIIPYWVLASAYGLVDNAEFVTTSNPVACTENRNVCNSYLFPGGLQTILPSLNASDPSPFVIVQNSPAIQMDFQQRTDSYNDFSSSNCLAYGDNRTKVGVELCVRANPDVPGGVIAGQNRSITSRRMIETNSPKRC
jgi:hypothetical protein